MALLLHRSIAWMRLVCAAFGLTISGGDLSASFLRTLAVGRRQQSESIEVALDMEQGGLVNRFDIGRRCHSWQSVA